MIEPSGSSLRVTAPMVIANAGVLLETGRRFLHSGRSSGDMVFDLSSVQETDSSALTLVFAWLRTAREHGTTLRITNPPASMVSLASLYSISDFLPLA